ncbi:MAG: hypothetical protein ACFFBH_14915 [Promethearchaeota archaeon]
MNKQRVLQEAQSIASDFRFWMVSGDISHLFGYVLETPDKKYELEIKFDDQFPESPPELIYYKEIKNLLGSFELHTLNVWTPGSKVTNVLKELKSKIENALSIEQVDKEVKAEPQVSVQKSQKAETIESDIKEQEEYITPDLNAYPPDFEYEQYITPEEPTQDHFPKADSEIQIPSQPEIIVEETETNLEVNTELGLIQHEYAYDQKGPFVGDIILYLTVTLAKTFLIELNFQKYPERPLITVPDEIRALLGDPYHFLSILRDWSVDNPPHVVEILRELEAKLHLVKDIELELKKISGEYHCDVDANDITKLTVHLVTYGFNEYLLDFDLSAYPKPPVINLSGNLQDLIKIPISKLSAYENWVENESESVGLIREIAWLVDKNSRVNFEIELLKEHYKDITYDPSTNSLKVDMKGKMKTQDLTFQFQIDLPIDYPMKVPTIKVLNEFDLDAHEKIKNDLQNSFKDFFDDWTPFSYLVDLFNSISKKIFEVSVVSCVICHKIECATCSLKIAGSDGETCHVDCPYCDRSYHKHCWEQTIKSFGKCGFCLKVPPPDLIP